MKQLFLFLVVAVGLMSVGCLKNEDTGLGYNVFADESVALLTITEANIEPLSFFYRNIRVSFTTIYDSLPIEQKESVHKIRTFQNGIAFGKLELNRTDFLATNLEVGTTVCFAIAFMTADEEFSRKSEEYCIEIE